jgi:hypothetical protein
VSADDALHTVAAMVLEDGRRWGEVAAPWQWADARAVLDVSGPRLHWLGRPRGGSKSTDLAAVAIAALLHQAPAASRSYVVAVDGDQADLLVDAARGLIERTEGLGECFRVLARQIIATHNAASVEVLPSDGASAWGLRPWLTIVDEAAQWPAGRNHARLWEALVSAVPKGGPTSRLVCLTSAGEPGHWSHRVYEHAKATPSWRVSDVEGPVPWWTEADLAEQRSLLTESSYARLILNRWTAAEDRLTSADAIAQCVRHSGALPPDGRYRYLLSLDIGVTNDRTVLAVGHRETFDDDGVLSAGVVLDDMRVWTPTKGRPVDLVEVADTIAVTSKLYGGAPLVFDPYQATHMTQTLRMRGVRSRPFTFSASSVGHLGLTLYRLLRDGLLDLPDDAELLAELAEVRLRESSPGVFRLDHDAGRHDDRAIALALLCVSLLEQPLTRRRSIVRTSIAGAD